MRILQGKCALQLDVRQVEQALHGLRVVELGKALAVALAHAGRGLRLQAGEHALDFGQLLFRQLEEVLADRQHLRRHLGDIVARLAIVQERAQRIAQVVAFEQHGEAGHALDRHSMVANQRGCEPADGEAVGVERRRTHGAQRRVRVERIGVAVARFPSSDIALEALREGVQRQHEGFRLERRRQADLRPAGHMFGALVPHGDRRLADPGGITDLNIGLEPRLEADEGCRCHLGGRDPLEAAMGCQARQSPAVVRRRNCRKQRIPIGRQLDLAGDPGATNAKRIDGLADERLRVRQALGADAERHGIEAAQSSS